MFKRSTKYSNGAANTSHTKQRFCRAFSTYPCGSPVPLLAVFPKFFLFHVSFASMGQNAGCGKYRGIHLDAVCLPFTLDHVHAPTAYPTDVDHHREIQARSVCSLELLLPSLVVHRSMQENHWARRLGLAWWPFELVPQHAWSKNWIRCPPISQNMTLAQLKTMQE